MSAAQIVYVVEAEDIGAVAAFSSDAAAREYITAADHMFPLDDLAVTALAVDEEAR